MTNDRTTLTISRHNYERFHDLAHEDETVDEAFGRLMDAAIGDDTDGGASPELADVLHGVLEERNVATADDVDDVLTNVPSETASEVENRLTRR